jgi:WG containing repeat
MRSIFFSIFSLISIGIFAQKPYIIPFQKGGKWGIIDSNKQFVIEPIFDQVGRGSGGDFWLKQKKGQVLRMDKNNFYQSDESDFVLIDSVGKIVLNNRYQSDPFFSVNHAVVKKGLEYIIVNRNGKEIIPAIELDGDHFYQGLSRVKQNGKYGFIDTNGIIIIPVIYDSSAYRFSEGLISLQQANKWGVFDTQNKGIVYFKYDRIEECRESRIAVLDFERGWGFIDKNGNEIIPPQYQYVSSFYEGIAYFEKDDKIGFMDSLGKIIVPPKYIYGGYFEEGRATIGDENHQGIIDKTGKVLIWTSKYSDIDYFSEGLAIVSDRKDEKDGYINLSGELVIPLKFDFAGDFQEGLAVVELQGKNGFINKEGKIVIPIKYEKAEDFYRGLAKVKLNGKEFYIDKSGKEYKE